MKNTKHLWNEMTVGVKIMLVIISPVILIYRFIRAWVSLGNTFWEIWESEAIEERAGIEK